MQPQTFNDDFDGLVIYANEVDERSGRMEGVFISDERAGSVPSTILAKSGQIVAEQKSLTLNLRLENGSIHRQTKSGDTGYQIVSFTAYDIHLNLGQSAVPENRTKKPNEISTADLLRGYRGNTDLERRKLTAELHQRLILPLTPFLFTFIGIPLGIQTQRSGRGGGFAIGLAVFLAYYILLSFGQTLVIESGWSSAVLWLPNFLFLAGGLLLLIQTARERRLMPSTGIFRSLRRPISLRSRE